MLVPTKRRTFLVAGLATSVLSLLPSVSSAEPADKINWNKIYDVIVIGSGGAGLSAGVSAAQNKASTVVLEKMDIVGGNTRITGGAFNAVDPVEQGKKGIKDSVELHAEQTLKGGDYRGNPELVREFTKRAPEALQWLKDCGVEFLPGVYQVYGGLYPRAHSSTKPFGLGYIEALENKCKELNVPILLNTKVVRLIREEPLSGRVIGVEVVNKRGKTQYLKAEKGVVIATGGFSANPQAQSLA